MRSRRTFAAALLGAAALLLPGCPGFRAMVKPLGFFPPPVLELPETIPQDFQLIVHVTDQQDPPADYTLRFDRSGQGAYEVVVRSPRRTVNSGGFELLENQVTSLYATIRAQSYETLEPRYPSGDDEGRDRKLGVQSYKVRCNSFSKEVIAAFQGVPALEAIRQQALQLIPEKAMVAAGATPAQPASVSRKVIGDARHRVFYWSDDPRVKDVPADVRQPFANYFEAVNYEYRPAPGVVLDSRRE